MGQSSLPESCIEEGKKEDFGSSETDLVYVGGDNGRVSNMMQAEISEGIDLFNHSQSNMQS